jgi:hypothetical protein
MGCRTASKRAQMNLIAEDNKDVILLAYLVSDYMRKTDNDSLTLSDLIKHDKLGRITNNFSSIELANWSNIWRGGYVLYFKFSPQRNKDSVQLQSHEIVPRNVKMKKEIGQSKAEIAVKYDGAIYFLYPERLYHVERIRLKGM